VEEFAVVVDKEDVTHTEASRALTVWLSYHRGRDRDDAPHTALLKFNFKAPLVGSHNEVRHNGVYDRPLTQLAGGEATP
jgi:hypothetical protein